MPRQCVATHLAVGHAAAAAREGAPPHGPVDPQCAAPCTGHVSRTSEEAVGQARSAGGAGLPRLGPDNPAFHLALSSSAFHSIPTPMSAGRAGQTECRRRSAALASATAANFLEGGPIVVENTKQASRRCDRQRICRLRSSKPPLALSAGHRSCLISPIPTTCLKAPKTQSMSEPSQRSPASSPAGRERTAACGRTLLR